MGCEKAVGTLSAHLARKNDGTRPFQTSYVNIWEETLRRQGDLGYYELLRHFYLSLGKHPSSATFHLQITILESSLMLERIHTSYQVRVPPVMLYSLPHPFIILLLLSGPSTISVISTFSAAATPLPLMVTLLAKSTALATYVFVT